MKRFSLSNFLIKRIASAKAIITQSKELVSENGIKSLVMNDNGDFYISDGVKIILAVVLGALLLAALTLLFNSTIIPKITEAITDMFS